MKREEVNNILSEVKKILGIDDDFKIVLYPMKRKVASISLRNRTIRINKYFIDMLNEDQLKYVLIHELIHYKLGKLSHDDDFMRELKRFYSENDVDSIEKELLKIIATMSQKHDY